MLVVVESHTTGTAYYNLRNDGRVTFVSRSKCFDSPMINTRRSVGRKRLYHLVSTFGQSGGVGL